MPEANTVQTTKTLRVTVIDPREPEKAKLRVAAYARVSSDSTDQINSYLAQVDYYTRHISSNGDWDMVDVYADEGISGLDTRKRDEFNRMIADCRAGKIDRILVKSISRFARNTRDFLQYMRELMSLGVTIQFEKENIDTGKLTSEQTAAIYGAFAQMESTNHSSNMRFSVRMRMEKGLFVPPSMPFGYRLDSLDAVVIPDEANVVRRIFGAYLSGRGTANIAKQLNESGVPRSHGRDRWYHSTVTYILRNRFYVGDSIWQKTFKTDTIPFQKKRNHGERPQYFVESEHPGIISHEDFRRVQELMAVRGEQFTRSGVMAQSIFRGHIYCEECGALCRRKVTRGKVYWACKSHNANASQCGSRQIAERRIMAAAIRMQDKLKNSVPFVLHPMLVQLKELRELEMRTNSRLNDIDREIAHISERNHVLAQLKARGCVDSAIYLAQADGLASKLKSLRQLRRKVLESAGEDPVIQTTEGMIDYLQELPDSGGGIGPEFFESLVDRINTRDGDRVTFKLVNGLELAEPIESVAS